MADDPIPPNLDGLVAQLVEAIYDPTKLKRFERAISNAVTTGEITADAVIKKALQEAAEAGKLGKDFWETASGAVYGWMIALVLRNTFGVEASAYDLGKLGASGNRKAISAAITGKMVEGLTGGSTSIEASSQPAENYLNVILSQIFEHWVLGEIFEVGSGVIPFVEQIQGMGQLMDKIVTGLGLPDSSARVLRPYIDNLVVEPLRRHIDKTHRPTLLSPGEAARQIHRGRGSAEFWREEMRLQGLSEERIETVIASQQKFLSADQLGWLEWQGIIPQSEAVQTLRDQGYDEQNASKQLIIRRLEREDQISRRIAGDAMTAYENWLIDRPELRAFLDSSVTSAHERDLLLTAADARRGLNRKRLSSSQVAQCVRAGILAYRDYREALKREGYPDDDALALELLLRSQIEEQKTAEQNREQALAERAEEKRLRAEATAARRAEVAADRERKRRGAGADLERAVIRGLIPLARYEEILNPDYDADTIAIMVSLVESDRQAYLEQQQRAADAQQRAQRRNIDVGALQTAVLEGVLTIDDFAEHTALSTIDPRDRQILVETLRARKADRDDAQAARRAAEVAARARSIDLGRFEQLVRKGLRSLAQYDQLLVDLDFDDAARAAMRELLEQHILEDQRAAAARAAAEATAQGRGFSVEQFRRAVLLGQKPPAAFEQFLIDQRFSADTRALLVAELANDLSQAEAARATRAQPESAPKPRQLPLAIVRRAARLGVVSPAVYQARLEDVPYAADDIDLEMELLLLEIADVQAQRAGRSPATPELAVEEQQLASDAAQLHAQITDATKDRALSLGKLDELVVAGLKTLDEYWSDVIDLGYGADDAELLVALLAQQLEKRASKGGGA